MGQGTPSSDRSTSGPEDYLRSFPLSDDELVNPPLPTRGGVVEVHEPGADSRGHLLAEVPQQVLSPLLLDMFQCQPVGLELGDELSRAISQQRSVQINPSTV
jgi:hypothetical protein